MRTDSFAPISRIIAGLIRHDIPTQALTDRYRERSQFEDNTGRFLEALNDYMHTLGMMVVRDKLLAQDIYKLVENAQYPVITFFKGRQSNKPVPVILNKRNRGDLLAYFPDSDQPEETFTEAIDDLPQRLYTDEEDFVAYAIPYSFRSLVSRESDIQGKDTPVNRLLRMLSLDKKEILYVYFYAFIISLVSLSIPLGVQAVIELVSVGFVFRSLYILIGFIIATIAIAGGLQILQYLLVEVLQRRVFVRASIELTHRISRINTESLFGSYAPELMNRFFEVLTIQKGMPKLLIDLTGAVLQILFGLMLLMFYHPYFIVFGVVLIVLLGILAYSTGPKGLRTSLIESKYKYKVAHWLEELARTMYTFKMAGHTSLPMQKTDYLIENYLHYRKKHFKVLMSQFVQIVSFKTLVTGGLLIIGSILVMERQISLGQFVASEIVIILILASVEKVILSMSNIYDMLTAVEKLGLVTDLPLERSGGIQHIPHREGGAHLRLMNLSYKYPSSAFNAINHLDLEIKPGERVCIAGFNGSGKNTLAQLLTGFLPSYQGTILLNSISLRDANLASLRDRIAINISQEDIFDGSLLDNISMGKPEVGYQEVIDALERVGLTEYVNNLPDGLLTDLIAGGRPFSGSTAIRFIIARCIVVKPQLLILNDLLNELSYDEKCRMTSYLSDPSNPWTLICVSNDPLVVQRCNRVVLLDRGKIIADGTPDEVKGHESFSACVAEVD
jgi:ABC-type bacteriocin/lantibiotic exporter with double-glycine peptidase domain